MNSEKQQKRQKLLTCLGGTLVTSEPVYSSYILLQQEWKVLPIASPPRQSSSRTEPCLPYGQLSKLNPMSGRGQTALNAAQHVEPGPRKTVHVNHFRAAGGQAGWLLLPFGSCEEEVVNYCSLVLGMYRGEISVP